MYKLHKVSRLNIEDRIIQSQRKKSENMKIPLLSQKRPDLKDDPGVIIEVGFAGCTPALQNIL